MKNFSKFGFSVVNAGQRSVNVAPQLIATTTNGGFRVTAPLSKALGLKHGGYAMFINNVAEVDQAIYNNDPEIVAFANEHGFDLASKEGREAIHEAYDVWGLAAGYLMKDKTGAALKSKERLTAVDKKKIVETRFEEIYNAAMASDDENLKAALEAAETDEQKVELLIDGITADEVDKYKGSKLANTAGLSGSDVTLNFTDSATYAKLRGTCPKNMLRIYDVDIDNIVNVTVNNGFEDINVPVAILGEYTEEEGGRSKAENE